jgi:hypothetical protein
MHGGVGYPMLAIRDDMMLIADRLGVEKPVYVQAACLAAMARYGEADTIAVVAEAWLRYAEPGDPIPAPGELEARSEHDPTIKTAIICHAVDVQSGERLSGVAEAFLDDGGHPDWSMQFATNDLTVPDDPLTYAVRVMGQIVAPPSITELLFVTERLGFDVVEVRL